MAIALVAIFPLPYGYYTFARIAVCLSSALAAYSLIGKRSTFWIGFAIISILFNPIFPIYLTKAIWLPIDLITAAAFGWMAYKAKD
ncbi:MAG: hypothetical protein P8H92_14385 [Paracoccaceae bacterium]|nr:hypothetical protein [Paracoccaceae bacterium]